MANLSDFSNFTTGNGSLDGNASDSVFHDAPIFVLPLWRQIVWSALFAVMVVVATGGNLIVIWIVLAHKRMRTVTNYFLVNLSIADAMVSTLNVTFNFTFMLNSHWPFGLVYCKINQFVAILSVSASVFTLMAISIDRYMAIMKPLRPRMGRRTTLAITTSIWVLSCLCSAPMMFVSTVFYQPLKDGGERIICFSQWSHDSDTNFYLDQIFNIHLLVLTYILPIGSMTFTYMRVGIELWGSQSIGECTQRQLENIRSKRRVVKMMIVVVIIFAVCWLPYHLYFILVTKYPKLSFLPSIQEIYLGIYWLAMSNSMYNPIIYCWMNSRFRRGFKKFFQWCPGVHLTPETLTRGEVVTSRYSCSGSPETQCRIIRNGSVHMQLTEHTLDSNHPYYPNYMKHRGKRCRSKRPTHATTGLSCSSSLESQDQGSSRGIS